MPQRALVVLVALILASVNAWGLMLWRETQIPPPASSAPRYEFKVFSPFDSTFEFQMKREGQQGWRIVSCRRASDSVTDRMSYECIMERLAPPDPLL